MRGCAPIGFVLAFAALWLVSVLTNQLLHAPRRPYAADDTRPRAALLVVALVLALGACGVATWSALADLGVVGGENEYPVVSIVFASMVVGLLSAAIAVQKLAVPRAVRTEYDYFVIVCGSLLAFAVAGCYGILAINAP